MKTEPVVFAVHDTYHIMVPVTTESMMWVKIGEKEYYDESNGIMRSRTRIHRMIVPRKELNEAKSYTICEEEIVERKAYYTETGEITETTFAFRPVKNGPVRCYHISDTHNKSVEPVQAAKTYGEIDFLIMNGDIPDSSDKIEYFDTIYEIAAGVTHGQIPVVFARGNHDLRGLCAEMIADYTPNENGLTYYSFRIGDIWGIALDCAEDKDDTSVEYGHTVRCHAFRERQTAFIKRVIADKEYLEPGVKRRIVVVHNPFTMRHKGIFDIETETYSEWARLLKEHIKPDVMICGHMHYLDIHMPGCEQDNLGQPCPVIVGATVKYKEPYFAGAGIEFGEDEVVVSFTDNEGATLGVHTIKL